MNKFIALFVLWGATAFGAVIPTQNVRSVGTVAQLRLFATTGITVGASLTVEGYYAANDGGGGLYVWDATSVLSDNNGTVIQPTGVTTGRWLLIYFGSVSVKQFGAYGDGNASHDDTTAIQAALNLSVAQGVAVRVPPGTFYVSGLSVLGSHVSIYGAGSSVSTIIRKAGASPANVLQLGDIVAGNAATPYSFITVTGLTLDGNKSGVAQPTTDLTDWGLPLTKISNSHISDVRAQNCWNGGVGVFIDSNHNYIEASVYNCGAGYGSTEPGVDLNSSKYNVIHALTDSCQNGVRLLDNCWGNIIDATIYSAATIGVICSNQTTNESHNNIVRATIEGGCTAAGLVVTTNFKDSQFFITAKGLTGYAVHDALAISYPCTGNHFVVASQLGGIQSCLIENFSSTWTITTDRDGRSGSQGAVYAVDVTGNHNLISVNLTDTSTWQVRGVVFRSGATANQLTSYTYTNTADPFSDSGTSTQWIGLQPSWTDASYAAGWGTAFGPPYAPSGYAKDGLGNVRLRGTAANVSATPPSTIFTLPVGYRPSFKVAFTTNSNSLVATVVVDTSGNVILLDGDGTDLKLDGLTFPTTY